MARNKPKRQIRSEAELGNLLNDAIYNATEEVMRKIFLENSDLIWKYVYSAYTPKVYQRSEEFLESWNYMVKRTSDHHNPSTASSRVHGTFFYDHDMLSLDPSMAQHGTPEWLYDRVTKEEWHDAREYLADILYQGDSGPIFGYGPWQKKRDAWSKLIKMLDRGKIFTWFKQSMKAQGWNL